MCGAPMSSGSDELTAIDYRLLHLLLYPAEPTVIIKLTCHRQTVVVVAQ